MARSTRPNWAGGDRRTPTAGPGPLVAVVGSVVLLGSVVGMIWAAVTPAMSGRVLAADSAIIPAGEFPEEFAGVGTFALLLFGYGAVAVVIAWIASRRWRGPLGFAAVAVATVAGSLIAAWVGTRVADWRFDDPRSSPVGATFDVVPDLWLDGAVRGGVGGPWVLFVCAPLAAALVYLGFALAARTGDLGVGDLPDVGVDEPLRPTPQPM
ncbi:DUF2567 domain-containing protein [Gordonia sp. SID5947]|uniref:DUF2567 domain-containing protein n=1 Tax=Gordonia sp. SID5947 TaxID=2690315 RepID=UPI00136B8579|nr:DUF2567 domain-containing protein [Gordonia sp. SID5947]MYR05257.1 DUF2567 domain-containing protein [Gordonia sp. SID5947]